MAFCQKTVQEVDPLSISFFQDMSNGLMTLEEFILTQKQFYFAVSFFSRPMSALMARFPNPLSRLKILENILEEHGGFNQACFHETTFKEFLRTLDVDVESIGDVNLWPEVRAFNSTLMTACVFDEVEVGVGCLGAIEYMFAEVSSFIGRAVVRNNWVQQEDLKHYALHEKIDVEHADDFFQLIEGSWDDLQKRYHIQQGISMGVYIFSRLYRDLYYRVEGTVSK
jgi:pyrroloquinoline-quinone synthase